MGTPELDEQAKKDAEYLMKLEAQIENPNTSDLEMVKTLRQEHINAMGNSYAKVMQYIDSLKGMAHSQSELDASLNGMMGGGIVRGYARGGNIVAEEGFDLERLLEALAYVESGNNPDAVSPAGARGKFQIMPDTAGDPGYGVTPIDLENATEEEQRRLAKEYLLAMVEEFGNVDDALRAYNAGPGRVMQGGPFVKETEEYPRKVLARYEEQNSARRPETPTSNGASGRSPNGGIAGLPTIFDSLGGAPKAYLLGKQREQDPIELPAGLQAALEGLPSNGASGISPNGVNVRFDNPMGYNVNSISAGNKGIPPSGQYVLQELQEDIANAFNLTTPVERERQLAEREERRTPQAYRNENRPIAGTAEMAEAYMNKDLPIAGTAEQNDPLSNFLRLARDETRRKRERESESEGLSSLASQQQDRQLGSRFDQLIEQQLAEINKPRSKLSRLADIFTAIGASQGTSIPAALGYGTQNLRNMRQGISDRAQQQRQDVIDTLNSRYMVEQQMALRPSYEAEMYADEQIANGRTEPKSYFIAEWYRNEKAKELRLEALKIANDNASFAVAPPEEQERMIESIYTMLLGINDPFSGQQ